MRTLFWLLPLFLLFACDDDEQPQPSTEIRTTEQLTDALEDVLQDTEIPGFAVSVVSEGQVVFQQAFGWADVATQRPYINETVQPLASVSKTFVGAATAHAIAQGYFTLETPVNDLLPITLRNPKRPETDVIRVKHLVTHSSGLLDNIAIYFPANWYFLPGEDLSTPGAQAMQQLGIMQREGESLEDYLAAHYLPEGELYSSDLFADYGPGEGWQYSNIATALMAYLIEQASEQAFADYVQQHILQPLSMGSSTYRIEEVDLAELCTWYKDKATPFPFYANDSYPEGSLFTNNLDYGQYLLDMVQGSQGTSTNLFNAAAYEMLFADRLETGQVNADFGDNMGLFWLKEGPFAYHGGNDFGVSAHLKIDMDKGQGYSLMTNQDAVLNSNTYVKGSQQIDAIITTFLANQ